MPRLRSVAVADLSHAACYKAVTRIGDPWFTGANGIEPTAVSLAATSDTVMIEAPRRGVEVFLPSNCMHIPKSVDVGASRLWAVLPAQVLAHRHTQGSDRVDSENLRWQC